MPPAAPLTISGIHRIGKYSPVFDVFGPYTLSNKYRYYGKNDASGNDTNVPEMIVEACRMASADVDLSTYDYDNDGYIDNVYVFYAGAGEANGGSDDTVWLIAGGVW